jgi:hypothetical protein
MKVAVTVFFKVVRFGALMAVGMIMSCWVLAPCRLMGRSQHFEEVHCLQLEVLRWRFVFLQSVGTYRRVYTAPQHRRTSFLRLWKLIKKNAGISNFLLTKMTIFCSTCTFFERGWGHRMVPT